MSLSVNTNLASMYAQQSRSRTQSDVSTAISRLSSGLRINSASDDAAGLSIAARFTSQLRGTLQAGRNANDGISLAQTADGALASIGDDLQRVRELAVQSANASNSSTDRTSLQNEVSQLTAEIDRVATQTTFNGVNLLDGSFSSKAFQIGANVGQTVTVASLDSARSSDLGVYRGFASKNVGLGIPTNTQNGYTVAVGSGPPVFLGNLNCEAKAFADAYNNANFPGLSSSANATTANGTSAANASTAGTATVTINGIAITLTGQNGVAALSGNRSSAIAAINLHSSVTGVVASDTGSGVSLVAADGRNVEVLYAQGSFSGSTAADFGLTTTTLTGATYNLYYTQPPGVTGDIFNTQLPGAVISFIVGNTGTPVSAIDVSSVAGANDALASIDRALATVASSRAMLGAVQNRFASTIGNLQSSGENLAASRSRITDADFAQETARLVTSQVLQQSAAAILALANSLPNRVLALLK